MSIDGGFMVSSDDHSLVVSSASDHPPTPFVPSSMDVLELMWVNPWFEYILVLFVHRVINGGGAGVE